MALTGTESVQPSLEIDGDPLHVLQYSLTEALFAFSELTCEVVRQDDDLPEIAPLIGKPAKFVLKRTDEQQHAFIGQVIRAGYRQKGDDVQTLALTIVSPLWRLSQRRGCRIFQEKSVQEIVAGLLKELGIAADEQDWQLGQSYKSRVYVTQYRETDLDFVHRLLAEEGIYYAVSEDEGAMRIHFSDNPKGMGEIEGDTVLPYIQDFGFEDSLDAVFHLEHTTRLRPDRAFLRDYDPAKPQVQLEAGVDGAGPGSHVQEIYDYPGRFREPSVADRYTRVMVESLQADRSLTRGETGSLALRPGLRFTIDEHPYTPLNREHLVTKVVFEGRDQHAFAQDGAQEGSVCVCRFEAIPTQDSPYRPPRPSLAATIPGLQTALTVGPAGEEIYPSENAEVKVQFHWDREGAKDEKSSCWMRTSQLALGGGMLIPRMGWEVAVAFEEGDADRPITMSRLYNAEKPPPYALPAEKASMSLQTATTPGGGSVNEVKMSDTKGSECMSLGGSKDMSVSTGNNATESVGNNQAKTIGSNHTLEVAGALTNTIGADQSLTVSGDQTVGVGTLMVDDVGSHTLTIGGGRKMMIGGDHRRTVTGSSEETVSGAFIDVVAGNVDESAKSMTHDVSAALVELTAKSRSVVVGGKRTESSGAAKVILCKGGRGVTASSLNSQIGGAEIFALKGSRVDTAKGAYGEVAAGAQIAKAANITFEAKALLSVVMGGSTLTLTPASVTIAGAAVKVAGTAIGLGTILDN